MGSLFAPLPVVPADAILGRTEEVAADASPEKVNLAVGMYFDDSGHIPFGDSLALAGRTAATVQSLGGTGALALGAELLARVDSSSRVLLQEHVAVPRAGRCAARCVFRRS